MINLTSTAGKKRARAEILRAMTRLEWTGAREITPILNKQFSNAAGMVVRGVRNVDFAVDKEKAKMITVFKRHYRRTATSFNQMAMGKLGGAGVVAEHGLPISGDVEFIPEIKGFRDDFWTALNAYIPKHAAEQVTKVGKTTKTRIKNVIKRGMKKGKANQEIARDLRTIPKIANPKRAKMIARTETHNVAMHSIDESVKATGVKSTKDWMAANDARSRDIPGRGRIHVKAMATQKNIPQDKPFIVGGEKLMYPGDTAGSGWNVIFCRCVALYNVVKEVAKPKPGKVAGWGDDAKSIGVVENRLATRMRMAGVEKPVVDLTARTGPGMSVEAANIIGREYVRTANKFTEASNTIRRIKYGCPVGISPISRVNAYAWGSKSEIYLNPKWWSSRGFFRLKSSLKKCFNAGFHPSPTVEHTYVHEFAHSLVSSNAKVWEAKVKVSKIPALEGWKYKEARKVDIVRVYFNSMKRTGDRHYDLSSNPFFTNMRKRHALKPHEIGIPKVVSRYGMENFDEFLAEAFARYDQKTAKSWLAQMFEEMEMDKMMGVE